MPGMIEHENNPFSQVQDTEINLMRRTESITEPTTKIAELNEVIIEITETRHSLSVSFIICRRSNHNIYVSIGLGDIINRACTARGLVHYNAPNRSCKRR
jgi:hypothetical protein